MSLDDKITEKERAMLAVWDYPVSDKYTRIWQAMMTTGMPMSWDEGLEKVLESSEADNFALLGDSHLFIISIDKTVVVFLSQLRVQMCDTRPLSTAA